MTINAKSGGAWHAGQLKRRVDGVWVDAALWRKVGGVWKTDAPLSATDAPTTLSVASASATPQTAVETSTAQGGAAPYTYSWTKVSGGDIVANSSAAAQTTFSPGAALASGETRTAVFHCTVTDSLSATVIAGNVTVTLTRWSAPVATVDHASVSASGSATTETTGAATVSVTGGTAPFTYAWTKVSGGAITVTSASAASTTFSAASLTSGETRTGTFKCTVTDAHGLTSSVNVGVTIGRIVVLSASRSPASVSGSGATATITTTATDTASATGGQAPYTYSWAKVSGDAITAVSAGSATTAFKATGMANGEQRTATFACTVTDSAAQTATTTNVTVTITNTASTGATYTPAAGTYNRTATGTVTYTVSASASVPWTWSATDTTGLTASHASGASGTSIVFTLDATATADRSTVITLQSGGKTWTLNLTAYKTGGGEGVTYTPAAGEYGDAPSDGAASFTVGASASVTWTWSYSGNAPTASVASGGTGTDITFTLAQDSLDKTTTVTLQSGGQTWTIGLDTVGLCVAADSLILMADGTEKAAGNIVVGDSVWTRHEETLEWGAFRVSAITLASEPVFALIGHPSATAAHRFALPAWLARLLPERFRWFRTGWFGRPAGVATVAKITVEDAHTYMARHPKPRSRWRLSHNIKA